MIIVGIHTKVITFSRPRSGYLFEQRDLSGNHISTVDKRLIPLIHKTFEAVHKRWNPFFTSCVANKNTVGDPNNLSSSKCI